MKYRSERACIAAIVLHLIFCLICFGMSGWNRSSAIYASGWLFVFGSVFWLFTFIELRTLRAAEEEEREEKEFERRRGARETGKIFDEHKDSFDAFSARTRVKRLEKWFFPVLALISGIAAAFFAYLLLSGRIGRFEYGALTKQLPSIVFLGGIAFFSFIYSRYAVGLSQEIQNQGLRACSGAMFSGTILVSATLIAFVLSNFGYPLMEMVVFYVTSILIGLVGLELIINFIMHFYRPRVQGRITTPVYYSRILGLIALPQSIFRATAITLDYQFGFKVSETWFYQFFERAAAPLILYLLISLYLFTCVVIVQSNEEVIIERFGEPRRPALGPGIHLKRPWPFDKAHRYATLEVKELNIGIEPKKEPGKILIWSQAHHEQEFNFIVAQKSGNEQITGGMESADPAVAVNFVAMNLCLHYRIKDVFAYTYNRSNPEKTLEDLAYRELVKYCATADYNKFMGEGRANAELAAFKSISEAIKSQNLGIELLSANLIDIHPPVPTVADFEGIVGAQQEKEAKIWNAKGYASEILNKAAGTSRDALINAVREYDEAVRKREDAAAAGNEADVKSAQDALKKCEDAVAGYLLQAGGKVSEEMQKSDSERYRLKVLTKAESDSFHTQVEAYRINPSIYKLRFRLQAMTESIINSRKYIVPANSDNTEVLILNLEEKAPSILDVPLKENK